ncbi:MAG: CTP synthase [Candidatus Pacebacteria bacterium]|nr:CTP synthase [Candidatus Paceibacterota bacterium]
MKKQNHKYVFVIGGVMSGVGKGIATSSIGRILEAKGFNVNPIKIDPYLNVDAGTMNPTEHGEVFVLNSGLETDQDMGNYERFMEKDLTPEDYMTSGMVYKTVIDRERSLGYGGKFVEAIPHITNEIKERIVRSAKVNKSDISLIEIGGTVGDYQNILFIEAARTLKIRNPHDVFFILVSYLPVPSKLGEMKTRPTQNAVHQLNSYGVQPDMIIARSHIPLDQKRKQKIAIWCSISEENVISAPDVDSVYDVPVNFEKDKIGEIILKNLGLTAPKKGDVLKDWKKFVAKTKNGTSTLNIAVVGKYFDTGDFFLSDAYISVIEAVKFSAYWQNAKANLTWINSKDFETGKLKIEALEAYDGIIVPGGFGSSGIEGVIETIRFAREKGIPYFGLCYGMQLAVVEFARNVVGLKDANTTEINPKTKYPVIDIMSDQKVLLANGNYGGSMRLGSYPAHLKKGTVAMKAYGKAKISERHRHRYEVNPEFITQIEEQGLVFSGMSPSGKLMEIAELPESVHPFFLGTQFHPEFLARPLSPHPLFSAFITACLKTKK